MGKLFQACIAGLMLLPTAAWSAACTRDGQSVDEERFVPIGGIEQWITIRGADCRNPVVLFVHGGPGNPMSPFARTIYSEWEREFTLVQWDQRGAGQTFARNPSSEASSLTMERMAQDGVEVAGYLVKQLQGEHDLVTTPEMARRWFDSITAPDKVFVLLPRTGHDPNPALVQAQYKLLKERVARRR